MNKETLRLDPAIFHKLTSLAHGFNQTPEEFISSVVNGLVGDQDEDAAIMAECEKRWAEFEENRLAVPLDEVLDWIDSWGTENRKSAPQCRKF